MHKSEKSFHSMIPEEKIVGEVLPAPAVQSVWECVQIDLNAPISLECTTLASSYM